MRSKSWLSSRAIDLALFFFFPFFPSLLQSFYWGKQARRGNFSILQNRCFGAFTLRDFYERAFPCGDFQLLRCLVVNFTILASKKKHEIDTHHTRTHTHIHTYVYISLLDARQVSRAIRVSPSALRAASIKFPTVPSWRSFHTIGRQIFQPFYLPLLRDALSDSFVMINYNVFMFRVKFPECFAFCGSV